MADFVRIGDRYINLDNVADVRVNPRMRVLHVFYAGGGTMELTDDEADDLIAVLERRVTDVPEAHRRVFAPAHP